MKEEKVDQRSVNTIEYGNLDRLSYDASANGSMRTGRRDLGATGNIVFGLNSSRQGGL